MKRNHDVGGQPLTKIAGMCKFLSALCKIAFLLFAIWSVFVLVLMSYSLFTTEFTDDILPLAFAVPFLYALYSANTCLLPLVLGRMLGDISEGRTPFTLQNAKRLLFLALILLLYALLEMLLVTVDSQFILSVGEHSIEVGSFIRDLASNSGTTLNLFPLLMSAMFFALSYVFKYGVLLQQESDETL